MNRAKTMRHAAALGMVLALTACNPMVEGASARGEVATEMFDNATASWGALFTYRPPLPPQKPQTRYCYQTQSDVVCYDSVQPQLTSKLLGYQDGDQISWVQPGGGSLGASGGQPMVTRYSEAADAPVAAAQVAPMPLDTSAAPPAGEISVSNVPFASQKK